LEIKEKQAAAGVEIILLEDIPSPEEISRSVSAGSLFAERKLVVAENYLGSRKTLPELILPAGTGIVFWEGKELPKAFLAGLPSGVAVFSFPLPAVIFRLTDSLSPGKPLMIKYFRETLKQTTAEFIFLMLVRQFRLMLNPASLSPFQKSTAERQRKAFGMPAAQRLYQRLLEMDYQQKTGSLPTDLPCALELFLLSL
jgi:DNA polymerase III delta subunit